MHTLGKEKIVLLGLMSKMPFGGNIWLVVQYLIGLERLGYEAYYVEAHGCAPLKFLQHEGDDGWSKAAAFIDEVMQRFGFGDRWAYDAVYQDNRYYGMTRQQLHKLYGSAAAIINLHGGTELLPEHHQGGVRIYLGTDPVDVEVHLYNKVQKYIDLLEQHDVFFTWGSNYGRSDCQVPVSEQFEFHPTLPVVVPELWQASGGTRRKVFTTIGNWKQGRRNELRFKDEVYRWSKHLEFLKFIDLPRRTAQEFELALSGTSYDEADRQLLESNGWVVRDALTFSSDLDAYRCYILASHGEFTVAKDQNVRLRSGWFSERTAQYLAAGRPVITQETGFSNVLPTGRGLFAFSTMDEILAAVDRVNSDHARHCRQAHALAREYFSYEVVLKSMLRYAGL